MRVQIFKNAPGRVPRSKIIDLAARIGRGEKKQKTRANIVFIDDPTIRKLNTRFRHINKSTDVLSFNLGDGKDEDDLLGEVYISLETAFRDAADDGIGFDEAILKLCCHGLLHLHGYDHMKPAQAEKMRKREEQYLRRGER
ncbi:Endoribonuclease YbeY [Candidatus Zixiibacteriota bacterium]|nr:Endoribonuclease YbeY [candidate division Zixibacteria bacterium]